MKKYLLITLFISLLNTVIAQVAPPIEWQKCLGGTNEEAAFSINQATDGGYFISGFSDSNNGDVSGNHGQQDYWVMRTDANASIQWQRSLGGNSIDQANGSALTTDEDLIVAGYSYSSNGDVTGNHGSSDCWIVKLDATGNLLWEQSYGGTGDDGANSIQVTDDGGFIFAGYTASNDDDVSGNHGQYDYWVVKLDDLGNILWQKCYGGSSDDFAFAVQQTADSGFIVAGYSESLDGDVSTNNGLRDYWIVKLDASGNLEWQTALGGSSYDEAHAIYATANGYLVTGFCGSNDGDITGNHGGYDYWLVKLDLNGGLISQTCFGGTNVDQPFSVDATNDGGFVVGGQSASSNDDISDPHGGYDIWIIKVDSNVNLMCEKSIGGSADEYGSYSILQVADGGIVAGGSSLSNDIDVSGNHGGFIYGDAWVVKLLAGKPTGINDLSSDAISLFPNPAFDRINVNLVGPASNFSLRIYNSEGKSMELSETIQGSQIQLDAAGLSNGFYTIQIVDNKSGETAVANFIISR